MNSAAYTMNGCGLLPCLLCKDVLERTMIAYDCALILESYRAAITGRHVSNKRHFRLFKCEPFDVKFKSAILAELKEPHQVLVMVSRCLL